MNDNTSYDMQEDSLGSFSKELGQLLQQFEVEDDATSPLTAAPPIMRHDNATRTHALADSGRDDEVSLYSLRIHSLGD